MDHHTKLHIVATNLIVGAQLVQLIKCPIPIIIVNFIISLFSTQVVKQFAFYCVSSSMKPIDGVQSFHTLKFGKDKSLTVFT